MEATTRDDGLLQMPGEAVKAAGIAFVRIFLGVMWLFEVTVGHNWKIGGLASGANPTWMGPGAGDAVREDSASAIADGTYSWAAWMFDNIIIPNAEFFSYTVIAFQILLGVAFIVGFAVRPLAVVALGMDLSIFMLGNSRIPPFFMAMHLFVLATGAGYYYGLDGWIMERTRQTKSGVARAVRWLIDLPLFKRSYTPVAVAALSLLGMFFFLTIVTRATPRFAMVAMDLAVFAGLAALGLWAADRYGDRLGSLTAMLRIFIGFKFLHEIWTRTSPGVNALPGFAGVEAQSEVFTTIAANHWSLFGGLVETFILPVMGFWVVVFAVVQFGVGASMVIGYRTRLMGFVGLVYLGVLIALGMTRYAPFLFGLMVPVIALEGGRLLSLDRIQGRTPRFGLPVPKRLVPALIVLAAINAVAAAVTAFNVGITPNGYTDSMQSVVTAFVAIFSALLAVVGWLQQHPTLDHSGEALQAATEPSAR
ncbi:MAG: DoxX family membrane protein [Acidimicrobiia bacterium]